MAHSSEVGLEADSVVEVVLAVGVVEVAAGQSAAWAPLDTGPGSVF